MAPSERRRSAFLWGIPAAVIFLTRIPLGGWPYSDDEWRWSSAHFPLVGAGLGLVTGLVFVALMPIGEFPAALLAMAFSMLLTGCFHEDGLADSADALGGGYTPEKVFEILKDSRVGSFGAAALVVSITARAALLAQVGDAAPWLMMLVGCSARVAPIWQLVALPYATPQGSKSRDVARARPMNGVVATAWFLLVSAPLLVFGHLEWMRWGVLVLVLALLGVALARYWYRRVKGVTGDFLGATEQVGEIAALAILCYGVVHAP